MASEHEGHAWEKHSAPPKAWVAGHIDAYHGNHPAPSQQRGGHEEPEPMPRGGRDRATAGRRE